jgi:anti-sigma factor RsiW
MKPTADNEAGRPEMGRRDLADLTMLADGTLPAGRRAEVEARIAALPGGAELLENERRTVDTLRGATQVRAPMALRERIEADRARAGRAPHRRRAVLGSGLVAGLAVIALALVLALPGGTPGSPSVSQAASLALRGALSPPPPARNGARTTLARDVDEVYFPNWAGIGWKATGERVDRIDGRVLDTIYYRGYGKRIAYTIVGGSALAQPRIATVSRWNHTQLRSLARGGRTIVTWRRGGHTCILSGAGVRTHTLLRLAGAESATRS